MPFGRFLKEGGAAHPCALTDQVFPNELRLYRQLRMRQRDAEGLRERAVRSLRALHLETQAAVAHVDDASRCVVDADRQPADDWLTFPASWGAERRSCRRQLLRDEIEQA